MAIKATSAAEHVEASANDPHKLISLLMAGTLERIAQAKSSLTHNNAQETEILLGKIVAIIKGLRQSLNFDNGGDIAVNLDSLYEYMLDQITLDDIAAVHLPVLTEVESLMQEVKEGWDAMPESVAA